jgi:hypothetical protein
MGAFTRRFPSVVDGEDYDLIVGMDIIQNGDFQLLGRKS